MPKSFLRPIAFLLLTLLIAVGLYAFIFSTDTEYAPGYSESAFDSLNPGDSFQHVINTLGQPLSKRTVEPKITWIYTDHAHPGFEPDGGIRGTFTRFVFTPDGRVKSIYGQTEKHTSNTLLSSSYRTSIDGGFLALTPQQAKKLKSKTQHDIQKQFGPPTLQRRDLSTQYLIYSRSPSSSHFHMRKIGVDKHGRVTHIQKYFYWD